MRGISSPLHCLVRHRRPRVPDNIICWASRLERSFQTKQLLFTRRFLSVRVSRLASRLWAWAARKLLSGAARRMQITGVAWNPRTLWTFALRADRACNPGNVQTSAVGMSSRGQSCMSLSSYGKRQWTRPCPTYYDSAACHRQRIQVAMLCAECDGGQYANDQGTAVGGCAGCLPCFEDGCSRHHLPAEKCGRRCSSTDASTWQDGLVAILRNALCKDTGRKYRPLFSLLLFSLAK